MKQTEWTENRWARWILASSILLALVGCSASQSSIPSLPKPPSPPAEPSPSPESTQTQATKPSPPEAPEAPATEANEQGTRAEAGAEATGNEGSESQSAGAGESPAEPGEVGDVSAASGGLPSGAKTDEEQQAALDGRLSSSMSEFDGIILKEQELLDARREASGGSGGGGGGGSGAVGAGGGAGAPGGEAGEEGAESDGASIMARRGGVTTGGSPDQPPDATEVMDESGAPVEAGASQTTNGRVPPDVGDGHDDDIVARQLREAAVKEEDPELREKLWDEYRTYKSGTESK